MILERIAVSSLETNCYILGDEELGQCIVIDPGAQGEQILDKVAELNLEIKYVLNTHAHHDHIGANEVLLENSEAELLIHQADAEALVSPELNLSFLRPQESIEGPAADRELAAGDIVECGEWSLEVIHTPGHTPGGITLVGNGKLFTGDTLFAMGVGRTDFPQGSREQLQASIQKLLELDSDLEVYPGHGPTGRLGGIIKSNPFL
ncbi:MBL fold metallo-hydrolase [Fuchsiella alkaliacetigena]|uniref:MBL fold metallo-hydrolase n=1 Tax=Fuchsiella alkaliacetigena TaxID=957042 RepID=UPI00200B7A03|nr:MBL fold metallo-hydrolase [Fuchsiella alkaliacetigena]MCK8825230.1 MBL fold metallo-hydrolase [Fuchsiella alkaliacetigena]